MVAGVVALTIHAQGTGGSIRSGDEIGYGARLVHTPWAYARYVMMGVWPEALACFYPHPAVVAPETLTMAAPRFWGSLLLLLAVTGA